METNPVGGATEVNSKHFNSFEYFSVDNIVIIDATDALMRNSLLYCIMQGQQIKRCGMMSCCCKFKVGLPS